MCTDVFMHRINDPSVTHFCLILRLVLKEGASPPKTRQGVRAYQRPTVVDGIAEDKSVLPAWVEGVRESETGVRRDQQCATG